jgi:hypothetical protein
MICSFHEPARGRLARSTSESGKKVEFDAQVARQRAAAKMAARRFKVPIRS